MRINLFKKSITHAMDGIRFTYRNEQNFRIHVCWAFITIVFAFFLQCSPLEWIALGIIISSIFVGELMNTASEKLIDLIKPRLSEHVKVVKDCTAGAILILSFNAVVCGVIIFVPKLYTLLVYFLG